jgi:SAM-dependent methyltransferase
VRAAGLANNLRFIEGDACYLPFPDNTFDACFAFALLHYARGDGRQILTEMVRVVKPAGIIATIHPIDECPVPPQFADEALSSEISELEALLLQQADKLVADYLKDYRSTHWRSAAAVLEEVSGSKVQFRGLFLPTDPEELPLEKYAHYIDRQCRELVRRAKRAAELLTNVAKAEKGRIDGQLSRLSSLYTKRSELMKAQHKAGVRNYSWTAPPRLVIIARKCGYIRVPQ